MYTRTSLPQETDGLVKDVVRVDQNQMSAEYRYSLLSKFPFSDIFLLPESGPPIRAGWEEVRNKLRLREKEQHAVTTMLPLFKKIAKKIYSMLPPALSSGRTSRNSVKRFDAIDYKMEE